MPAESPTELNTEQWAELAARAVEVREQAYAPYSRFKVGAALLTADGRVFEGVNVENSSYGLTICAERTAACAAVAAGARRFAALVIASEDAVWPCGSCRQFLVEFADQLLVRACNPSASLGEIKRLAELLPNAFQLRDD